MRPLDDRDLQRFLEYLKTTRNPQRDRVMAALAYKAGLQPKEIANLTWASVTDHPREIAAFIRLPVDGKPATTRTALAGGRVISMHPLVRLMLSEFKDSPPSQERENTKWGKWPRQADLVVPAKYGQFTPNGISVWFDFHLKKIGV